MPTLKQLFGTPCELSELACDDCHPSSHGSQRSQTTETTYSPTNTGMFASSQSSLLGIPETDAANEDESDESKIFWSNLIERINWCDLLIHELCDVRGDDQVRRDDLILTRKRIAPDNIDADIRYLLEEIERVTLTSTPEPIRDCRDCEHHRGRNNNALRYCVSPDSAVQRDDALASAIVDCRVATRCNAFRSTAR